MVADLIFTKRDNTPWGFRLIGGADFDIPLTVTKVNEGSLAEQYGMLKGDVIVRINELPTPNLTHFEAHEVLIHAGNSFILGVLREKDVTPAGSSPKPTTAGSEKSVESNPASRTESRTSNYESTQEVTTLRQVTQQTNQQVTSAELSAIDSIIKDGPITDEEIAELISGEAEVLKNLNVIGVNFNRMMPKTMSLKTSAVFQRLNEEAIKTRHDLEEETKKWTTFLQKPDRPALKPKQIEDPNRAEPYRVKIVKQPKPRIAPDREATPPPREPTPEPVLELGPEPEYIDYIQERTEEFIQTEITAEEEFQAIAADIAQSELNKKQEEDEEEEESEEEDEEEQPVANTDESKDPVLAKQLTDVQNQLLALSQLPNTIQATLAAITQQIAHLLPTPSAPVEVKDKTKKKKKKKELAAVEQATDVSKPEEASPAKELSPEKTLVEVKTKNLPVYDDHPGEREPVIIDGEDTINEADKADAEQTEKPQKLTREEAELQRLEDEQRTHEEEWETKRQKEPAELKDDLQKELQQQMKDKPKRRPKSKQCFGGLTPQERPIFLPGGRKWRNPRDAYNEDFIAEVISSQAEIIKGTTLGLKYESSILGYDERVNFLKYQKPEKDVSFIKNSETYRMIHHLDAPIVSGIEARPEKVVAEEDLRRVLNANFHVHHENTLDIN